jgi:hypothetical protein
VALKLHTSVGSALGMVISSSMVSPVLRTRRRIWSPQFPVVIRRMSAPPPLEPLPAAAGPAAVNAVVAQSIAAAVHTRNLRRSVFMVDPPILRYEPIYQRAMEIR